ncbi:transcription factor HES-1 [Onthophagus taurus]|uniref:transcription factor HES-1 n=1 Tax=Onthophagus taurus TaxID=166361 RepID=UPI000C20804F|nr:transcription factor HES-1-A [Onthophagus taurus]
MPISEDEFDQNSVPEPTSTMSKAELRKTHKPIMEKRRRARINQCLNEIKSLILEALKKDPARHSKLEKADILEMAVKHLQNVQRQQLAMAMANDPTVLRKFKTGFNECAREVGQYIGQVDEQKTGLKDRVQTHLTKCINSIEHIAKYNAPGAGSLPFLSNGVNIFPQSNATDVSNSDDQNNNPRVQLPQGIQLIPSRLPTGELAFLLPNSSNLSFSTSGEKSVPNLELKSSDRPSAFAAVIPSYVVQKQQETKPLSPPLSPKDDVIIIDPPRSPSPRGFRPVNPTLHKSYQSAFISTANLGSRGIDRLSDDELKSIRYPIHKFSSPKKTAEPLCIITNHSERYKQAQVLDESSNFQENIRHGVKRKHIDNIDQSQGLLTVVSNEFLYPNKIRKTSMESHPNNSRSSEDLSIAKNIEDQPSTSSSSSGGPSQEHSENSNDMWRPW